jgi:hypothetical protein
LAGQIEMRNDGNKNLHFLDNSGFVDTKRGSRALEDMVYVSADKGRNHQAFGSDGFVIPYGHYIRQFFCVQCFVFYI